MIAAQALLSGLTELSARASHDLVGPLNQAGCAVGALHQTPWEPAGSRTRPSCSNFCKAASTRMESVAGGFRKYMEIAARPPSFGAVDLNISLASSLVQLEKAISESGAVIVSDSAPDRIG